MKPYEADVQGIIDEVAYTPPGIFLEAIGRAMRPGLANDISDTSCLDVHSDPQAGLPLRSRD